MISTELVSDNEARFGKDYEILIQVYVDGLKTKPSTAYITIWDYAGKKLVDNESCSIDKTSKQITYTIDSDLLKNREEGYQMEVNFTISTGSSYYCNYLFDVVMCPLSCPVSDENLKIEHPDIMDDIWDGKSTYSDQISGAFAEVKRDLKSKGNRPAMLIDATQIKDLIVAKTFCKIFFDFAKNETDIWWLRYQKEESRYNNLFSNLSIKYDADEDGVIDSWKTFGNVDLVR